MERDLKSMKDGIFKLDPSFIPVINLVNNTDKLIEAKYVE